MLIFRKYISKRNVGKLMQFINEKGRNVDLYSTKTGMKILIILQNMIFH